MRAPFRCLWLCCALLGHQLAAGAETRVPLVIDEPYAGRTVSWPITTGVPFPRGLLKEAAHCRLVDDLNREQPLQAKVAATWDAEKTSIRWLTIDFIAEPGRKYSLVVDEQTKKTTISDDRWTPDEAIVARVMAAEHYYLDEQGTRFSSAADGKDRVITREVVGPLHHSLRIDGYYTGPRGERIAKYRTRYHFFKGMPLVKVDDELHFSGSTKGKRFRDIGYSLPLEQPGQNRRVTVDASGAAGNQLKTIDWQPDTRSVSSYQKIYRHYGNPECLGEVAVFKDKAASEKEVTTVVSSEHVGEWMQVADEQSSITGSLRWFWQQFPKEWEAARNHLTLHLWSPQAGELDFDKAGIEQFFGEAGKNYLRVGLETRKNPLDRYFFHADQAAIERGAADGLGINKHHEFWLIFAPSSAAAKAQEYAHLAAVPPLCLASGEWNISTDVFGPLAARPNDSKYEASVDKLFDLSRQVQDEFGDYGWWLFGAGPHYSYHLDEKTGKHYADARRFEFHTYGKETQLWWNYLRSGERKFHDWAIPAENHWVDIAVAHEPTTIQCDWLGGEHQPNRTLHWRPGEWSIDNPTHYVRTHDRAEAWLRGGAQYWASYHRTLETTTLANYITGDERYNDVVNYWREYWGGLAGVTNRSKDVPAWYREQAWWREPKEGEPAKTWAEMIRDYAPFSSGSRHQMTLFFNLATLYEHTWDPRAKQALAEYAAAFLDSAHPIGVWRSQDNSLPAHADAPLMGHFWVPALWKYARVTNDPRMKDIFARYFAAGYAADPFREDEKVGVYSNSYVGYAYYFTRDARFLALAENELNQLLPNAAPLANPQEINSRLYNPYAPARTFAGVPRLIWALQTAAKNGVPVPHQPYRPQRTAIVLQKAANEALTATLWGFEPELKIIDPTGAEQKNFRVTTKKYASEIQPFDRKLPDYDVFLHELVIDAQAAAGSYLLAPQVELAVLQTNSSEIPLWNAARPVEVKLGETVWVQPPRESAALSIQSAVPAMWRVRTRTGELVSGKVTGDRVEFAAAAQQDQPLQIDIVPGGRNRTGWFQIVNREPVDCWVQPGGEADSLLNRSVNVTPKTLAATLTPAIAIDPQQTFVAGRFGRGVQIAPGNPLHIPDHLVKGDQKEPLCSEQQGTIEFWVKRQWDDRLSPIKQPAILANGLRTVPGHADLPLNEWAHIALVWAPYEDQGTISYVYVNGRDPAVYRSLNWAGYSSARPSTGVKGAKWLEELVAKAVPGAAYAIDELRISRTPRYADLKIAYGPQQTFNPVRFEPPSKPFAADDDTTLLLHFDDDLRAAVPKELPAAKFDK
ncbi:hypothetical protein ETAA8_11310 [Anatilimnocola aggregata]|uniref:Uncharacterized protein n=1 Tax=Anatilimnocola aggregata TaxID=2528021 RepID=A0A517Y745_9BACT|nr:LamG domain-containing protein [Anatilimnocola aggregata]QDU26059.1 hypothetical protein ETAA8_11310 [Anatilimnocola aggregata]